MKFRKSRHLRKQVKFYQIHYGYHSPAIVIIDGNFLKTAIEKQMDIKFQFERYTKMQCQLKLTTCILSELQELRSHFPGVYAEAKKYPLIRCGHVKGVPAHECLTDILSNKPSKDANNPNQYYWILTQDEALRDTLIHKEHNMLILMEPSHYLKRKLEQIEHDKFMPNPEEYKLIAPIQKEEKKARIEKEIEKIRAERREQQIKVRVPAKGPNPLSIMKKSKTIQKVRKRRHKMKHRKHKSQRQPATVVVD